MRRVLCPAVLLLALAYAPLWGGPKVKGERTYRPYEKIVLEAAEVSSDKAQFLWDVSGDAQTEEVGRKLYVWASPGRYVVTLTAIDFDSKKVERTKFTFTIEGDRPPGPGPTPGPTPTPTPTPTPARPVLGFDGLAVFVVYETAELSKLPKDQAPVLTSATVRKYLKEKCAADGTAADGKAYRIWDKDADASNESKAWQDALRRERKGLPWLIVSSPKGNYEGPLPGSVDDTLKLLRQYGGD